MHIVLGILALAVGAVVLLNRLAEAGIDIGGLNPFLWNRRRKWRKLYEGNPIHKIEDSMDATAIMMVAAAKADGDLTSESKSQLLNLFETEFHLSKKDAAGLLISSSHLLGDGNDVRKNVKKFLQPSQDNFTADQAKSAIELISKAAGPVDKRHPSADDFVIQVRQALQIEPDQTSTW